MQYIVPYLSSEAVKEGCCTSIWRQPISLIVSAIRHETGGWRWVAFSIGLQLGLSLSLAIVVFQIARLA
jgi:Fe2+ transport system protein B